MQAGRHKRVASMRVATQAGRLAGRASRPPLQYGGGDKEGATASAEQINGIERQQVKCANKAVAGLTMAKQLGRTGWWEHRNEESLNDGTPATQGATLVCKTDSIDCTLHPKSMTPIPTQPYASDYKLCWG